MKFVNFKRRNVPSQAGLWRVGPPFLCSWKFAMGDAERALNIDWSAISTDTATSTGIVEDEKTLV